MSRTRPIWSRTGSLTTTPAVLYLPSEWRSIKIETDTRALAQLGRSYAAPAVAAVNGITTLTSEGSPTGGTFQIRVYPAGADAVLTAAIPYNDTAANIKTALIATGYFATGDITAAGGALPTAVTLTWTGVYAATVPPLEIVNSLTGGTNARIRAATSTPAAGNGGYVYLAGGTQEFWTSMTEGSVGDRFLYLAATVGTGNYLVSAYR